MGLAELEDPALVSTFREFVITRYQRQVRMAALDGWFRAAPNDPRLASLLRKMTGDRNRSVRFAALKKLGKLHRRKDLGFLRQYAVEEPDPNLAQEARNAIEMIAAFTGE